VILRFRQRWNPEHLRPGRTSCLHYGNVECSEGLHVYHPGSVMRPPIKPNRRRVHRRRS
jgi:hypothetical protein